MSNTHKIMQSPIYESYSMLHLDGTLMCHTTQKKAKWYIDRNLATWVDEKTFKLNFEPNGHGKSTNPYYTQKMENQCVCCGSKEMLNKHHVVPYVFRSRLPTEYKESNHHDVLATCIDCHEEYETFATMYKEELAQACGVSMNMKTSPIYNQNRRILSARKILDKIKQGELLDKEGHLVIIPPERIKELELRAKDEVTTDIPTNNPVWADVIIENVLENNTLFEFIQNWRKHFVQIMKPQYLPEHWSVDSPLEVSGRAAKKTKLT